jgi:hypothetical protein
MGASEDEVKVVLHVDQEYLLWLAQDGSSGLREFECKDRFVCELRWDERQKTGGSKGRFEKTLTGTLMVSSSEGTARRRGKMNGGPGRQWYRWLVFICKAERYPRDHVDIDSRVSRSSGDRMKSGAVTGLLACCHENAEQGGLMTVHSVGAPERPSMRQPRQDTPPLVYEYAHFGKGYLVCVTKPLH